MVDKYSFASGSHLNPLFPAFHLTVSTDKILSDQWHWAELFSMTYREKMYFLIIVKQFSIIIWQRPFSLSLCLWICNEEVMFGALAMILGPWGEQIQASGCEISKAATPRTIVYRRPLVWENAPPFLFMCYCPPFNSDQLYSDWSGPHVWLQVFNFQHE